MPTQTSNTPSAAANLTGTVLDNLQAGSPLQPQISATLNAALKTQLAAVATAANLPALVGLINAMPAVDLAAAKDLTLQAFAQQQIDPMVGGDPAMKTAIDNEIAKLPATGTVSTALSLTSPLATHPLLKGIVADAQLTSLLATSPAITSAMQARFVTLYNANQGAMPDFWTQLASDPQWVVPQLQLTLQLGTLTQNNTDLVAKLQAQFHPTSVRDLTKLTTDQVVQFMTSENVQVPASIAATTTPATIAQYAATIISTLKQAFPTDYVAKSFAASTDPVNQAVATFLDKSSDFDFSATNIDNYWKNNSAAFAGLSADQVAALTDRLKAAQRVFRVITDGDVMQSLINLGLDSSYEIAATPSGSFLAQYAESLGGEAQAQQIYANATNIMGVTSLVIRQAQENASGLMPRVIAGSNDGTGKNPLDNLPNWQTLFGTTSTCQCAECRAIDGPAAYFVSLLEFLRRLGKNKYGNTPLDVLIGSDNSGHGSVKNPRRPDLAHLKLNCANADTALPYVDLVNEIMESYVANKQLSNSTAHDTPLDATTAVLDVTPEYMQTPDATKAYQALVASDLVYPFTLPFDRYLETERNYLNFLGPSRYQLLQAFGLPHNATGPGSSRMAAEALLISELEYILITNADFSGPVIPPQTLLADYFGYTGLSRDDSSWQTDIAQVPVFLSRTGLAFSDLLNLLGTQYLNPQRLDPQKAVTLTNPADPCDITSMVIQNVDSFLQPLPGFLRLWRKLGWQISELDYALRAFGEAPRTTEGDLPHPIPAKFILIAAQLKQLQDTLNLSVSQVVSLWKDIDTDGRKSQYMSLFQNKAVLNPPDSAFQLQYQVPLNTTSPLRGTPANWSDGTSQASAFYQPTTPTMEGQLQFIGSMTESQRDDLLKLWAGTNDAAIMAVQILYSQRWYNGIDVVKTIVVLRPGTPFTVFADSIDKHINPIIAALRISVSDLLAIGTDAGSYSPSSQTWESLSVGNLSALYRYAILAQSLGYSVPDLITLKNLTGLKPFQIYSGAGRPETDPMVQFVAAARQVAASQFTAAQLAYLYGPISDPVSNLAPLQTTQDLVISTILVGLQNIAAANAFAPDPTGAALRKKLAVLLPSALQLDPTMGLISGSAVYTSPLAAGLPSGLTLPSLPPVQVSFVTTVTVGGTITANDELSLTVTSNALGSPAPVSYVVQASDTLNMIAAALAALINHDPTLAAANITATVAGAVISLPAPANVSSSPVWTTSSNPAVVSETVTLINNLVCQGPLSTATVNALVALQGADANFTNAVQDLRNQAQNVLTENLGFLAGPGPYATPLSALPVGVLPSDQVSVGTSVTIGGTITAQNVLSLTMTSSAVTGSPVTVSYTVLSGDKPNAVAAELAAAINRNPELVTAGISATVSGAMISLSAPPTLTPSPVWTVGPNSASEPLTFGYDLVSPGPMLNSTRISLLSSDAGFSEAVNILYAQAWEPATTKLIEVAPGSPPADRYNYVLEGLQAYLINTQSRNLVTQSLAQALGLDPSVVGLLLDGNASLGVTTGLLPSNADPTQLAMSDFLGGLSGTYYSSSAPDPQHIQTVRIDLGVDLDGTESPFGSVQWTGKLLASTTGAYSFSVPVSSAAPGGGASPQITLKIGGQAVTPVTVGSASGTINPIKLTAGQLYEISLIIKDVPASAIIQLQWGIAPLGTFVTIPAVAFMPCDGNGAYPSLALLYRIAVLVNGFSMSSTEIAYLSTHPTDFAGIDPITGKSVPFSLAGLPAAAAEDAPALFNQWQRLSAIYGLKASMPAANVTLFDVFAAAAAAAEANPPVTTIPVQQITTATGWNRADIQTLTGPTGFNLAVSNFRNEIWLLQLASCLSICTNVGVSAQKLIAWANPTRSADSSGIAQDIQNTVKAKYDDATWLQVGKPLNDKLRESSKEALIAYILYSMPNPAYSDADDLYGYFLIDVEMCSCMETSRLVQASAAVQLFVQRCLLNLESSNADAWLNIEPSAFQPADILEWHQWRKNYRVWQAAVWMFMYPENWVVPELRPNKTPFFEDLETALLQGDVTEDNVEAAFLGYLESLQQVARLEIAGIYTDDDTQAGTKITHVIGRTFTTPYVYFYRNLDNTTFTWSPWEQISADIAGDSIIPVVWNRRLFLFWPIYNEVTDPTDPSQNSTQPPTITSGASTSGGASSTTTISQPSPTLKTLQIQLAWSEYKNNKWTPKQLTVDYLVPVFYSIYSFSLDTSMFAFAVDTESMQQDGLTIVCYNINTVGLNDAINYLSAAISYIYNTSIANTDGNNNITSYGIDQTVIPAATQQLNLALTKLKSVSAYGPNPMYSQNLSDALKYINQAINATPTDNSTTPEAYETYYEGMQSAKTALEKIKNEYKLISQGAFSFDGPQGSVKIDNNSLHYNLDPENMSSEIYSLTWGDFQYSYQGIYSFPTSGFNLVMSDDYGMYPNVKNILKKKQLKKKQLNIAYTISISPDNIPLYCLDLEQNNFQNAVFFSDSRRNYFVVDSLPLTRSLLAEPALAASVGYDTGTVFFFDHYHPWVGEFIKRLNWMGISCLLDPKTQALNTAHPQSGQTYQFDFASYYDPTEYVVKPFPVELVDFGPNPTEQISEQQPASVNNTTSPAGDFAYSMYNWEIFFYIPLLIATRLSQNQQFDDAETWFRYIFDPTQDPNRTVPQGYKNGTPNCYWNFKPFNALPQDKKEELANLLASASGPNPNLLFNAQLDAWQQTPFEPDVIAKFRPVAYQKNVVMKYLDHLLRRGDYCFGQKTRESINESIQYYILADQILGKKSVIIKQPGVVLDQTYYDLVRDKGGIYGLGNANVLLENAFPFVVSGTISVTGKPTGKGLIPTTPYFCTPDNPTLLGYYDTVADRLYKIRHCMNIQGQVEQLPLFSAPINPALLVAAEAAGVDLSSVLNDINAAVPHYRFSTMLAKALELCGEVRSLGAALLSAMEKYDAEGLALLRSNQEVTVQQAVLLIKQQQVQEANDNLAGLQATQAVTTARQTYYQGLVQGGLSDYEITQAAAMGVSEVLKLVSSISETGAAGLALIPQIAIGINGAFGSPSVIVTIGGEQTSRAASAASRAVSALAEASSFAATTAGFLGGWDRRSAEWQFQLDTVTLELAQIQQQLNAASIRVQIATQDVTNQDLLIANASAVQDALKSKFTNQDLYSWMVGQVSAVFFQCYQMAYDLAKRAEACYRFELGIPQSSYIQFGYWDSLKQGLLSGEKLFQDLKRLEIAYLDQNQREYEISKSISLLLLDPSAFVSLKLTGQCLISLPEAFFDMDYPGHYMRRIRSVSLTIPCVTGPYTSVNCTLTLLQSKVRVTNALPYAETPVGSDDLRFSYNFSATESIATSTAQNDSGLFEVNFRDERYLPFEGPGVISQWQLSMPPDCNAFDFETITDVILNLRYTARNGGDGLRLAAKSAAVLPPRPTQSGGILSTPFPKQTNLLRYFSLRHEYPTEWYKFHHPSAGTTGTTTTASMQINLSKDRFPFQYRRMNIKITQAKLVVVFNDSSFSPPPGLQSAFTLSSPKQSTTEPDPSTTVPLSTIPNPLPGNTLDLLTSNPPMPAPAVQGGPNCWILQCPDLSQLPIADIFLVCEFSAPSP